MAADNTCGQRAHPGCFPARERFRPLLLHFVAGRVDQSGKHHRLYQDGVRGHLQHEFSDFVGFRLSRLTRGFDFQILLQSCPSGAGTSAHSDCHKQRPDFIDVLFCRWLCYDHSANSNRKMPLCCLSLEGKDKCVFLFFFE